MKLNLWFSILGMGLISPFFYGDAIVAQAENYFVAQAVLPLSSKNKSVSGQDEEKILNQIMTKAVKLLKQKKSAEAITLIETEKLINRWKAIHPEDNLKTASLLNFSGILYLAQGKHSKAEIFFVEGLEMRKRLLGNSHSDVADSNENLYRLYAIQGEYEKAEPFLIDVVKMRRGLLGNNHLDVAKSIDNLASLYRHQGEYGTAESLVMEALEIKKRLLNSNHPEIASSLNQLAILSFSRGQYQEAESLFIESLNMKKQLLGENNPELPGILSNLAELYRIQGKYGDAESLYLEALSISESTEFLDNSFSKFPLLSNLALLYLYQGKYSDAEDLLVKVLNSAEKYTGKESFYVATSFGNLALVYESQERYSEAEQLLQKALAIKKHLLFDNHPDLAVSLSNMSLFYQARVQYSQALDYLFQATEVQEKIIAKNLIVGSEKQKKQFIDKFQNHTDNAISFHLQAIPENREAAELALTTILRRKGRVLDATGQALQTLRDNLDLQSQQLFIQLASTQTKLANLSSRPLPNDANQRKNIQAQQAELDQEIKQLEAQLSSRSAEFKQETTPVTIAAVQQAISENAALVEFIQYKPFDAKESIYGEPRYAVYVLLSDGQMQWQDLGEASVIDDKIQRFRNLLGNSGERGLGVEQAESGIDATKKVARELDELLMKPVRTMIGNTSHLLLSPDSQLNTLPFAALVDEQDKYLVENYLITYLTSGRDLLRLQLNQDRDTSQPLLMANPTYSSQGVAVASADIKADKEDNTRGRRSGELGKLEFASLPGTKVEGEAIAQLVPGIKIFTEQEASENNLKRTENPEFLHLATHGFFLPPQPQEPNDNRNSGLIDNQIPVFSTAENPLLRSGLALAGFNQRDSGTEDGVLTALEVTGLNLRGTKLVVMSACETGLGDVQAGEGVYGLRRAFTLAGAQSQLMSLWSVDDEGTKDLMVEYYRRIQNGEARGEALRQVQLEMLQSENRNHPFYWAAFIPSGSWLSLDSDN